MLRNLSTGKGIMQKVRLANSPAARGKGLMFESAEKFDYALVFVLESETRLGASVHMMFVRFPIDIVYMDAGKKVVDIAMVLP